MEGKKRKILREQNTVELEEKGNENNLSHVLFTLCSGLADRRSKAKSNKIYY